MTHAQIIAEICGWTANILSISSYILLTKGILKGTRAPYNILISVVCFLYCIYGFLINSPAIIALDLAYGTIAVIAIYHSSHKKAKVLALKKTYSIESNKGKDEPLPEDATRVIIQYSENTSPTVFIYEPGRTKEDELEVIITDRKKVAKIIRFLESNQV